MPFGTMPNSGISRPAAYRVPRSLRAAGITAASFLALDLLACAAAVIVLSHRLDLVRLVMDGKAVTIARAENADNAVQAATIIFGILVAATAAPFIVWSYRFVDNVRSLGREPRPGPSWAIAGWFIPIANFGLPARTLMSADRHSDGAGRSHRWLIVLWTVALAIGGIIAREASQLLVSGVGGTQSLASIVRADEGERLGYGLLGLAALLAVLIVVDLTRRQERALQRAAGRNEWPGGRIQGVDHAGY